MPRGAKKRKAAKKKQENRPTNHSPSSTTPFHGNEEDMKHRDGKLTDDVRVERVFTFGEGEKSKRISSEEDMTHHDGKQTDDVRVERMFTFGEGEQSNRISGPADKSQNGGGSCTSDSGNISDDEVLGAEKSLHAEDICRAAGSVKAFHGIQVEDVGNITSDDSEKTPLLVAESVKTESLVEDNENKPTGDGTSEERNKEVIVQSDIEAVTEALLVTEKQTSWRSCCGLFEVFSGSGR